MCRGCEEFNQAVESGKHDHLFKSEDRTPEGREKWLMLYSMAFVAHSGGGMLYQMALVAFAADHDMGPEEVYPVLYRLATAHQKSFMDTNQDNLKVIAMDTLKESMAATYKLNVGHDLLVAVEISREVNPN